MIRYSILVDGRVQGVGFRFFTQMTALPLNLTGWCQNLDNGNVQIEVQGPEENILSFINTIKQGNRFSKIYDMEVNIIPTIQTEKKFTIKY